jgi:tRNA-dihydrouridine synthase B
MDVPWIIAQAAAFLRGSAVPGPGVQFETVVEHFEAMLANHGARAGVPVARKHLGWYSAGPQGRPSFAGRLTGPGRQ